MAQRSKFYYIYHKYSRVEDIVINKASYTMVHLSNHNRAELQVHKTLMGLIFFLVEWALQGK